MPDNQTLEAIYDPDIMQGAMKQLMDEQDGPLTEISSTQGCYPHKVSRYFTNVRYLIIITNRF